MPKRINKKKEEHILEIAKTTNKTYAAIAAQAGCSNATVCRVLQKHYKNANGNKPISK